MVARMLSRALPLSVLVLPLLATACGRGSGASGMALSKVDGRPLPEVAVPAADGPRLGAIAKVTPVYERPEPGAAPLGFLQAGAQVARAEKPYGKDGCPGGFFPVRPRGFVCLDQGATLDMAHPALAALGVPPKLDQPLPYSYARAKTLANVYELVPGGGTRVVASMPKGSTFAFVRSTKANDASGKPTSMTLLPDGRLVDVADTVLVKPSAFHGRELADPKAPPIAFIVKDGIVPVRFSQGKMERMPPLARLAPISLTGKFRSKGTEKYWALEDGSYVRARDIVIASRRETFPEFVRDGTKWIDVSVIAGTMVLYEGRKPVYATLVSVGEGKLAGPQTTKQGSFAITSKQVTAARSAPNAFDGAVEARDVPWAMELASGQMIHGALWHERFGIDHGPGNLQLSPEDAAFVWKWVDVEVPEGWHGATAQNAEGKGTTVLVRN